MGRQTFYYHFGAKYDLIRWIFTEKTTAILDEWISKEPWGKSPGRVLSMIASDKLFYRKAMKKRDSDIFFSQFYDFSVQYYLRQLRELYGMDHIDEDLMFQIRFNCHGSTNMTRNWLEMDFFIYYLIFFSKRNMPSWNWSSVSCSSHESFGSG